MPLNSLIQESKNPMCTYMSLPLYVYAMPLSSSRKNYLSANRRPAAMAVGVNSTWYVDVNSFAMIGSNQKWHALPFHRHPRPRILLWRPSSSDTRPPISACKEEMRKIYPPILYAIGTLWSRSTIKNYGSVNGMDRPFTISLHAGRCTV